MKILICSRLFYPSNAIGAVRPSNFAKYLAKFGHEITVITEDKQNKKGTEFQGVRIIRISNSKSIQSLINKVQNYYYSAHKANNHLNILSEPQRTRKIKIIAILHNFMQLYKIVRMRIYDFVLEADWFLSAKKTIKRKYKKDSFDIVISSFGPIESLLLGYFIKKSKIARHWISDLRDSMENIFNPSWLNLLYKIIKRSMVQKADAITLVSQGQVSLFCKSLKKITLNKDKIFMIYNGYENKFKSIQYEKRDKVLRISYTGAIYENLGDFELLFKALTDLIEEQLIDLNSVVLCYAGQHSVNFNKQLFPYDTIKKICHNVGFVDRNSAIDIQNCSDILIVLTWNTITNQGILTGKFMEYLQAFKPIISITKGNLPNGELSQLVEKLNLGIACEYITFEKDYNRLKEYLLTQYKRVLEGKPLLFEPDIEGIKKFHYEILTKELDKICLNIK